MVTSVKIDEETKARLERLQAKVKLETGKRVTHQEILARLIEPAVEAESDLVDSFRERRVPVSEADRSVFQEGAVASGEDTTEDDIDDLLYEWRH